MPARAAGTAYGVIEKVLAGFGRFEHLIMVARSSNLIPCGEFGHDKGGRSRTLGQEARSSLSFTVLAPPHTSRRPACVLKSAAKGYPKLCGKGDVDGREPWGMLMRGWCDSAVVTLERLGGRAISVIATRKAGHRVGWEYRREIVIPNPES